MLKDHVWLSVTSLFIRRVLLLLLVV